jgi:hypothetical protein
MRSKTFVGLLLSSLIFTTLITSCSKNEENLLESALIKISPLQAGYGDSVIIVGNHLFKSGINPTVTINGIDLKIIKCTNDTVKFVIPKMLGSGTVSVQQEGKTYTGLEFIYKYKATVTTLAGSGEVGKADGKGSAASFNYPWGLATNDVGDLYIADSYNRLIRKISATTQIVSTIKFPDGLGFFGSPYNLTVGNNQKDLFVTDFNINVLKITNEDKFNIIYKGVMPTTGIVMGKDDMLYVSNNSNGTIMKMDSLGKNAEQIISGIYLPRNLFLDSKDMLYVAAQGQATSSTSLYRFTTTGSKSNVFTVTNGGVWEMTADAFGNFYIADHADNVLRIIEKNGRVSVLAGSGIAKDEDGVGLQASFDGPTGITTDKKGNIFISTYNSLKKTGNKIRKVVIE